MWQHSREIRASDSRSWEGLIQEPFEFAYLSVLDNTFLQSAGRVEALHLMHCSFFLGDS